MLSLRVKLECSRRPGNSFSKVKPVSGAKEKTEIDSKVAVARKQLQESDLEDGVGGKCKCRVKI